MRALVVVAALCLAGCAGTFELLIGDRYDRTSVERTPTAQRIERIEYRAEPEGGALQCLATERRVERERSVTKLYRRRNGLDPGTYTAAAVLDGLLAAGLGGLMVGLCVQADRDLSCWHAAWAAPFAVDLVYGLVRLRGALPGVLTAKLASRDHLALGGQPVRQESTGCESVVEVHLGQADGPTDESTLQTGEPSRRTLLAGSVPVGLGEGRTLSFSPDAITGWLGAPAAGLWVLDQAGEAHGVTGVVRCQVLRGHLDAIAPERLATLNEQCPLAPATP